MLSLLLATSLLAERPEPMERPPDVFVEAVLVEQCGAPFSVADQAKNIDTSGWTPGLVAEASERAGVHVHTRPRLLTRMNEQARIEIGVEGQTYSLQVRPTERRGRLTLAVAQRSSGELPLEQESKFPIAPGAMIWLPGPAMEGTHCESSMLFLRALPVHSEFEMRLDALASEGEVTRHFDGKRGGAQKRTARRLLAEAPFGEFL